MSDIFLRIVGIRVRRNSRPRQWKLRPSVSELSHLSRVKLFQLLDLTLTRNNPDQARNDGRRGVINTFSYSKDVSTIMAESLVTARKVMHITEKYVLESHQRERIMM